MDPIDDANCPAAADEPLAVLNACHRRLEKECSKLLDLADGVCSDPVEAARAALRYFDNVGRNHHEEDEEAGLFPLLHAAAKSEAEPLLADLRAAHREIDALWQELRPALQTCTQDAEAPIDAELARRFDALYRDHIVAEESGLFPLARRALSEENWRQLAARMEARKKR
jgi:hemerythrin-like domain-containing protein